MLTIYVRLTEAETELVKRVAGEGKHNVWAKRTLLEAAEQAIAIPVEEVDTALREYGFTDEQRARVLARFR